MYRKTIYIVKDILDLFALTGGLVLIMLGWFILPERFEKQIFETLLEKKEERYE